MVETYPIDSGAERAFAESADPGDPGDLPRISVIIPVYDDPEGIRKTARSVTATTYPNYELRVVYTPADGATREVLAELEASASEVIVHEEAEYRTPGAARNVGIEQGDADVFLFVDADMTLGEQTLWKLAYVFAKHEVDYLGFPVRLDPDTVEQTLAGWYDEHIRFPNEYFIENVEFCPTCSLAVRGRILADGLRFNPTLVSGEDVVFGHEAFFYDHVNVGFCPDVTVNHPVRNATSEIFEKGVKTGVGFYQIYRQYNIPHVGERSRLLSPRAYLPRKPLFVRQACREWETLSLSRKLLVHMYAYIENLGQTWGYLRSVFERPPDEPPEMLREMHEKLYARHQSDD